MHQDDRVVGVVIDLVVGLVQDIPVGSVEVGEFIVDAHSGIAHKINAGVIKALKDLSGQFKMNVHLTAVLDDGVPELGGTVIVNLEILHHLHGGAVETALFQEHS